MIVWLASYPRSGNTFLRVILHTVFGIKTYSIYNDVDDIAADAKTSEVVGHLMLPEGFDLQKAREEALTYYIKTHQLPDENVAKEDKVIYLIRDGRESTLSFMKHQNAYATQTMSLRDVMYGKAFAGSWADHVRIWSPKNRPNVMLIQFEALVETPTAFIERIARFLRIEPVGGSIPSFEDLKTMNPRFFRSGEKSSWEKMYSEEEHKVFWIKSYREMVEYGYDDKKPPLPWCIWCARIKDAVKYYVQNSGPIHGSPKC